MTLWTYKEVGHNQEAKKEIKAFNSTNVFATPKPERLIQRILTLATNEGDLVLDSFLGSGTTAAVAHKMGRRWIGIELGDHAETHCLPRLRKVVDGKDPGGITKSVNWQGGGGFKYYRLAPSLLNRDHAGQWVISKDYNPDMLAAALAKQEGFIYAPDPQHYWKQGHGTEQDFIFTTTAFVTIEMLTRIREEMRDEDSLLICCTSYQQECRTAFDNITVKKIPKMLMNRCEFGKEDYSLNIIDLPNERPEPTPTTIEENDTPTPDPAENAPADSPQLNIFDKQDRS